MQVCIYAFDLLYINGESLVSRPLRHRRDVLKSSFPAVEGEFTFASSLITNDTDRVAEFLDESIKGKQHFTLLCCVLGCYYGVVSVL